MKGYEWAGWGFLPLILPKDESESIMARQPWKHWSEGMDPIQVKDIRRFYTRSSASTLRPVKGGRYSLDLSETALGRLSVETDTFQVDLVKLQLLAMDGAVLIYFHMTSDSQYSAKEISTINRTVFAWQPRTHHHQVVEWKNAHGVKKCLRDHIADLLSISIDSESDYGEDAFGHELANCCWVKKVGNTVSEKLCVSELSAGINLSDPRYSLSESELENLKSNQFSYWKDWRCQFNLSRFVFIDETPGKSSLHFNLFEYHYYLDLFAMVIFQRIMLNHFKDELILASEKSQKKLYQRISEFRRHYKVSSISTYPFAGKLYQYLCDQADLDAIEEKTFTELEHSHALWKQDKEETSGTVMLFLALIAALLLPASSIATIVALSKEQMNINYWSISAAITLVTMVVIVWPPVKRCLVRRKKR